MILWIQVLLTGFLFNCTPATKEEVKDGGWDIVLSGKVGYPQAGEIYIQEIRQDGKVKRDTITLRKDYSFAKRLHLSEAGFYNVNFFNRQSINLMLNKSNVELNVDGNNQQGFVQIKGSPDHDLISKVQMMMSQSQSGPAMMALQTEYEKAVAANDNQKVTMLQNQAIDLMDKGKADLVALLRQEPASLALFNILQDPNLIDKDKHADLFVTSSEKFKKD
ncbi:MAG: DUF4369 domain-containing protein, partial [Cyclobacteriaceae bacterium]